MRADKKAERDRLKALEGLKALLMESGKVQEDEFEEMAHTQMVAHSQAQQKMLQAEGMLYHLRHVQGMIRKQCLWCEEIFASSYVSIAYCSDNCRARDFQRKMGVRWKYERDYYESTRQERPLVVGPKCYQLLVDFAKDILAQNGVVVDPSLDESDEQFPQLMDVPHTTPVVSLPQSDEIEESLEDLLDLFE